MNYKTVLNIKKKIPLTIDVIRDELEVIIGRTITLLCFRSSCSMGSSC